MYSRLNKGVTRAVLRPPRLHSMLTPTRQIWVPLMLAGVVVAAGSTILKYVGPAVKRTFEDGEQASYNEHQNEEDDDQSRYNDSPKKSSGDVKTTKSNKEFTHNPYHFTIGMDIGSSSSKVSYAGNKTTDGNSYQLLENMDGKRHTPTAFYLSPDDGVCSIGYFAKVRRFTKKQNTLYGLNPTNEFFQKCTELLPLHYPMLTQKNMESSKSSNALLYSIMVANLLTVATNKIENTGNHDILLNISLPSNCSEKDQEYIKSLTMQVLSSNVDSALNYNGY